MVVARIAPNFLRDVWGNNCKGVLGMIFAPGRYKPKQPTIIRNLQQDLRTLKQSYKTDTIVSLIEDQQLSQLRITNKQPLCMSLNIKHLKYPIKDYTTPPELDTFKAFVRQVVEQEIRADRVVIAHCKAGLGRTGLFAGSCLVFAGMPGPDAVELVRKVRPGTLETDEQVDFVRNLRF